MVNPPKPPEGPKPTKAQFACMFQQNSTQYLAPLVPHLTTQHSLSSSLEVAGSSLEPLISNTSQTQSSAC